MIYVKDKEKRKLIGYQAKDNGDLILKDYAGSAYRIDSATLSIKVVPASFKEYGDNDGYLPVYEGDVITMKVE